MDIKRLAKKNHPPSPAVSMAKYGIVIKRAIIVNSFPATLFIWFIDFLLFLYTKLISANDNRNHVHSHIPVNNILYNIIVITRILSYFT